MTAVGWRMPEARRFTLLFYIFLGFFCFVLTEILPPMQSPDEPEHVKRAWFLTQGVILLEHPQGNLSGGPIDSGLSDYMVFSKQWNQRPDLRLTQRDIATFESFRWSHQNVFSVAAGTGYYFPLIYLPQAVGLWTGRALDLSIDKSYRLARGLATVSVIMITLSAFALYTPNGLVLALLAMPMTLFQSSSASLDGMATAVTLLALSAFMRIMREKEAASPRLFWIMCISLVLVCTCRTHALPMLLLPFVAWFSLRRRNLLPAAVLATILSVAWTMVAMKTTAYSETYGHISTDHRLLNYVLHPGVVAGYVIRTLCDSSTRNFYFVSFVGDLGWLDTPLSAHAYKVLGILLVVAFALALPRKFLRQRIMEQGVLVIMMVGALLLTFLALLLSWTPAGSPIIVGVQGRYLLIPALFLAYALTDTEKRGQVIGNMLPAIAILLFSVHQMLPTILFRYYIAP